PAAPPRPARGRHRRDGLDGTRGRARRRAHPRCDAPGRQTGQRRDGQGGPGTPDRLRDRPQDRRLHDDDGGLRPRHARVPRPRGRVRRARHAGVGRLAAGGHDLLRAHRPPAARPSRRRGVGAAGGGRRGAAHAPADPFGAPGPAAGGAGHQPAPQAVAALGAGHAGRLAAPGREPAGRPRRRRRPGPVTSEPPTRGRGRILGVDAARAVALVGMFATHIFPLRVGREPTLTGLVASGRASALFAVLAGVGVALATGGTRRPAAGRERLAAGAALVGRGVLVGALGLTLVALDAPVAIILSYYGLLFVVAAFLLRLPRGALAAGAVLACALAPVVSQLLRSGLPDGPGRQVGWWALAAPGDALVTLLLTGYYPVLTWTTYLLAGMAVGRLDLRRPQVAAGLLVGGAALAVAAHTASSLLLGPGNGVWVLGAAASERRYGTTPTGNWWWLAADTPHSGSP